jgi:hypothetical protein
MALLKTQVRCLAALPKLSMSRSIDRYCFKAQGVTDAWHFRAVARPDELAPAIIESAAASLIPTSSGAVGSIAIKHRHIVVLREEPVVNEFPEFSPTSPCMFLRRSATSCEIDYP